MQHTQGYQKFDVACEQCPNQLQGTIYADKSIQNAVI